MYEVWIKYNLDIETVDGVPVDSWFLPAYGKTPSSYLLSRTKAIEDATIVALRDAGKAVLLVSVELDEIMSLSDRIAVMFDGQIMGERLPAETDEKELGLLMAGMTGEGE